MNFLKKSRLSGILICRFLCLKSSRCEKCGGSEDRVFKQVTEIEKFPKFLIIQLVRFVSGISSYKINLIPRR